MTISNTIRTAGPFIGNGITTAFPFTFKVFKKEEVLAVQTDVSTGVATPLILNSGYSVVLNADQNASPGGTATTAAPLATGQTLILTSDLAYLQPLDITNGGGFYPAVLNAALDRLTIFCQQLFSLARRSIKLPLSDAGMNTELPSAVARANKLLGFDSSGRPIVAAPVSGSATEVAMALAAAIAAYLSSSGASLIGWIQNGFGATLRTVQDKNREIVSPSDFGAVLNGTTDDSAAIQKAVLYLANNGGGTLRFPEGSPHTVKILTSVLVPGYVIIDLNGYTVYGGGIGVNYVFESAYLSAGVLVTNIGTPLQSHNLLQMKIINGLIVNAKGIRLQNCLDSCDFSGLGFTNCTENLNETACFYSMHRGLVSRGGAGGSVLPAYKFNNNVNAQIFDSVSVIDRSVGIEVSGGVNGASFRALNAEVGGTGVRFKDNIEAMNVDSGYFEALTTVGLDFTDTNIKACATINNNYFNGAAVAIWGVKMGSGVTVGRGNGYVNTPVAVRINDNSSYATVEVFDTIDINNVMPVLRPEYELGPNINVIGRNLLVNVAGAAIGSNVVSNPIGVLSLNYSGRSGYSPNRVMFTTVTSVPTTGTKFNIVIETRIFYDPYCFYEFKFNITDNIGVFKYWGTGAGQDIIMHPLPVGKNVTISVVNTYIVLTLGEHDHPTGTYTAEGIVRIK